MNIFLDTTVLYNDFFLNKIKSEQLLEIARMGEVEIFISKVVLMEAKRHFKVQLQEKLSYTQKALKEINRIPNLPVMDSNLPKIDDALAQFDEYYNELEQEGAINIVPYNGDMMDDLVHRAVHRIKPFSENKSEFRDAVIWLSYVKLAEDENLEDCVLITDNKSDYMKGNELHPDLQKDTNKIRIVKDIFALLQEPSLKPHVINIELQTWVDDNEVQKGTILSALHGTQNYNLIMGAVYDYSSNLGPYDISDDYYGSGYVETDDISIVDVTEFDFEVVGEKIFINGIVLVKASLDSHVYIGEGDYYHAGTNTVELEIIFIGEFNKESGDIGNLEIEDFHATIKSTPNEPDDYPDDFYIEDEQ